ncbi:MULTISPECIES: DUF4199 domain-containing protein [Asticcacaulis]|uniref:DUF4199 domain-containing protein n=1 Tax=Asticcacaulis TaxID=76890 RepID=UPI001AE82F7A|nr:MULTISPECIES: DUF4199 domain-containing protein [Asticcacaulis]MBP2160139.1 hypothetical protein [Asticcacaulis solisilvae]MDR6801184.1 hypothetical protein [Asticcacaulis sp. BE141]
MLKKILSYGAIAGIIVGLPMFLMTVSLKGHPPAPWGMVIGYTTMLVALSTVFIAVKRHRDAELGGVIKFWPAFGLGLGISIVAGILYVLTWEAAQAVSGIDFAGDYSRELIEAQKAKGIGGAELARFTAEMEAFRTNYANPLWRLPMTFAEIFPVGILVSLVSAALLRNSRFLPARR